MCEIAIIGIGCRFPGGVRDAASYWDFLLNKGDGVTDIPSDRWSVTKYYDPDPDVPGRMYTRRGGFLTDSLWDFDPEFFGISPREASIMDTQQRLLLEVSWEALDDAGLAGSVAGGPVGVYIGAFTADSAITRVGMSARMDVTGHTPMAYTLTLLSNRISYVLDLRGPSMTIDTACSSSLVAFHQATQAILAGECEIALTGGVNAITQPEPFVSMCKGRFLAPDGRSKAFDESADGYGRGEGAGVVVLKQLEAARRDGDRIYAIVRGTGVNQDGRTAAIPVPNPAAQESLARRVCADAGVAPTDVAYVEAHGTGTPVGDPLEISALGAVYGKHSGRQDPLFVGSVKASIGHLEAAAGIAGVIKTALTLHHRTIVPQGWLKSPNPEIPFNELNIVVPTTSQSLEERAGNVFAAVNSFGYGGANAHAVLQAATQSPNGVAKGTFPVLPVSGRSPNAVRDLAGSFASLVQADTDLDALVAGAWTRRAHHQFRTAFDYSDRNDLLTKLQNFAAGTGRPAGRAISGDAAHPVFVFSGMGPQWWAMGRDLLNAHGEFARTARIIDDEFRLIAGWSIIEELSHTEERSKVTNTEIAQPANFLVQVALVAELAALGVRPAAVVGHSVGEVSAAYVSGTLSLREALLVSYHRSRLQATTRGAMIAVGLSEEDALAAIPEGDQLSIAAVNSPAAVTLAGDHDAINRMYENLTEVGAFARLLKVEVAYHSHLMDPILDELRAALADLQPQPPSIPLYSTVTSDRVAGPEWDANYWCRNVRQPVRFADAVATLTAAGHRVFLEVGPNPVLSGNIREILVRANEAGTSIGTLSRKEGDFVSLRRAVAELYTIGALDGTTIPGGPSAAPHVALPTYPWQKTRMWTESDSVIWERMAPDIRFPMLGQAREPSASEWTVELSVAALDWLHDHVVEGVVILPGAAYLDAALSAAAIRTGREDLMVEDIRFITPLIIDPHDVPVLRLAVEESTKRFRLSSRPATGSTWTTHATGRFVEGPVVPAVIATPPGLDAVTVSGEEIYAALAARGLLYGRAFQGILEAKVGVDTVFATIDTSVAKDSAHLAHPAVLDVALQCVAPLVAGSNVAAEGALVPARVGTVRRFGPIPEKARVLVRLVDNDPLRANVDLLDAQGNQVVAMAGVEYRPISQPGSPLHRLGKFFYEPKWELSDGASTAPAEPELTEEFALVISWGDFAAQRATAIAGRHPHGFSLAVADPLSPRVTENIAAALRDGLAPQSTRRANVIVVAGREFDASANVTALAGVAKAMAQVSGEFSAGDDEESGQSSIEISAAVITTHGFSVPGSMTAADMAQAALVGARRSLLSEQPMFGWRLIDTEPDTTIDELAAEVLRSVGPDDRADELSLCLGSRWALRVQSNLAEHLEARNATHTLEDPETSFALEVPDTRLLGDLAWREAERIEPRDGQIEVRMDAIGLNPKDAFKVLGVLTARDMADTFFEMDIGLEGSGTVVRIGPHVSDIKVGDRVGVCARDMFRRFLTIDEEFATLIPATWPAGACSSNVPFLTAEFALVDSARIQRGETVLIHGGAGGVGLAAIQVARAHGATVIATAGTKDRRSYVLGAGAHHALDSRSMNFVEEIMQITEGRGVDVILNSAPGEVIRQNFKVAAEFGRVVDIGKIDIYSGGVIELEPFDHNLTFIALDLDRMLKYRPELVRAKTTMLVDKFKTGAYQHLPYHMYSVNDLAGAFGAIVRPTGIGRIVVDLNESGPIVRPQLPTPGIRSDAQYLITGGFGAFGLATARWLVRQGARHLILAGRSGPTTVEAKDQLLAFAEAGVQVDEERVDVADYPAVAAIIEHTTSSDLPLRGVFHAAGVLANCPLSSITAEFATDVLEPKLRGAVNLDRAVRELDVELDHFVLWSSISGLIGGYGQTCYAAANAGLQSLAHSRHSRGEPALCVDWGWMSGGGMAEANEETIRYLSAVGLRPIHMDPATDYLSECLGLEVPHVSIFDMDWGAAVATTYAVAHSGRFADFASGTAGQDSGAALRAEILALPADERGPALTAALTEVMAVVLGVTPEAVDVETPLLELGLDSLMGVEFAARTSKLIGMELSPVDMARSLGQGLSRIGAKMAAELETMEVAKTA
jgi:acyl transferase domain-containing protein/NADPH:quinone reductase-like Zn-dependent oxidoreductase